MHICLITNLPVWSLGKGKGAPSFYKTLKLYNDKGDRVTLVTTEQQLDLSELENVTVIQLPKYKIIQNRAFAGALRLVHKYLIYILNQFSGLRYLNKYAMSADVVYAYEIGFVPPVTHGTLGQQQAQAPPRKASHGSSRSLNIERTTTATINPC